MASVRLLGGFLQRSPKTFACASDSKLMKLVADCLKSNQNEIKLVMLVVG